MYYGYLPGPFALWEYCPTVLPIIGIEHEIAKILYRPHLDTTGI